MLLLLPLAFPLYRTIAFRYLTFAAPAASLIVAWFCLGVAPRLKRWIRVGFSIVSIPIMITISSTVFYLVGCYSLETKNYTKRVIAAVEHYKKTSNIKHVYLIQRPFEYKILDEAYERLGGPKLESDLMTLTTEPRRRFIDMNSLSKNLMTIICKGNPKICEYQKIEIIFLGKNSFRLRAIEPSHFTLRLFDLPGHNDPHDRRRLSYMDPHRDFRIREIRTDGESGYPQSLLVSFSTPIDDPERLILVDQQTGFKALGRGIEQGHAMGISY